jgi:hypothetical protein
MGMRGLGLDGLHPKYSLQGWTASELGPPNGEGRAAAPALGCTGVGAHEAHARLLGGYKFPVVEDTGIRHAHRAKKLETQAIWSCQ